MSRIYLAHTREERLYPPIKGTFLGRPIFEYENNKNNPTEHLHILIWLNCHTQTETLEEAGEYYETLLKLLCYRSKILYAYSEACWCNQKARRGSRQLEATAQEFRQLSSEPTTRLKQLKEWLLEIPKTAFEYARYLREL
jgi:hypothetical protein